MSVVSVDEIHTGRSASDDIGSLGEGAKSEDTRKFRVITNNVYDGAGTALQSCDNLGVVHPTFSWLYVKRRRAVHEGNSKLVWVASLKYDSERERVENPLAQRVEVNWDTEYTQENAYVDINGDAVMNSASDYYEDGVPVDAGRWVAKVHANVADVPVWIDSYRDAINSDTFWLDGRTFTARTAKMSGISIGTWKRLNGIRYRPINLTIKFKTTWEFSILDQGLRRIVSIDGEDKREKCIDEDGSTVTKPVLLDGSGAQLTNPTPSTAVFNTHYIYPELPFSALPLY